MRSPGQIACLWALTVGLTGCLDVPSGKVFVTSGFEDRIYVLDARTGAILDTVAVNQRRGEIDEPHGVAVAPTGDHWYATLSHGDPTLWKFETGTDRLVGRVVLPQRGASRVGVSPDGLFGVVPDYFRGDVESSKVTLVALSTLEVIGSSEPCRAPHDAQFSPDGLTVAITCALGDEVVEVDAASLSVLTRHRLNEGSRPMNLVWTPDGGRLLVTLMGADQLLSIELDGEAGESSVRMRTTATGASPAQVAITPDGTLLATANRKNRSVSIFDATTLTERRRLEVPGEHPHGLTFDDSGEMLFVTYEGTTTEPGGVVAFDRSGDRLWSTEVGNFTLGVAYGATPD